MLVEGAFLHPQPKCVVVSPTYKAEILKKLFNIYTHAFLSILRSHPLPGKNAKIRPQPAFCPNINIRDTPSLLRILTLFLLVHLNPNFFYKRVY